MINSVSSWLKVECTAEQANRANLTVLGFKLSTFHVAA